METKKTGPLVGVRVADFTQLAQGPWATQMLGDLGAEIIKIEPPKGDWMRHYAYGNQYPGGESVSFLSFNRNKKSIVLDLKEEKGVETAKKIIAGSAILIENFRPGVMDRLGLGYEAMKAVNPGLIYCSSSGYGSSGPYKDRPGQDLLAQAISGVPFLNGRQGDLPTVTAVGQADLLTALFIVQAVLAALHYRSQTGKGQLIEACLLNSILSFHTQEITSFLATGKLPERSSAGIPNPWLGAPYGIYRTSDGYIAIGMNSVRKLARLLAIPELDTEQYETNNKIDERDTVFGILQQRLKEKTTGDWLEVLLPADIWCSHVNELDTMINDPQVRYNQMIVKFTHPTAGEIATTGFPVSFSETPCNLYAPPPALGEHTELILDNLTVIDKHE